MNIPPMKHTFAEEIAALTVAIVVVISLRQITGIRKGKRLLANEIASILNDVQQDESFYVDLVAFELGIDRFKNRHQ